MPLCEHKEYEHICTRCGLDKAIKNSKYPIDDGVLKYLKYYREHLERFAEKNEKSKDVTCLDWDKARQIAIKSLRAMADKLEKTPGLGIFYIEMPGDPPAEDLMDSITVTVSYPWPG
jgi:hypothetical protein